eukprot:gene10908-12713_t
MTDKKTGSLKSSGGIRQSPPSSRHSTPSIATPSSTPPSQSPLKNSSIHSRSSSAGNYTSTGGLLSTKSPMARVQQGHSRKGSKSSSTRWGSSPLSYQDYVDEQLFYSAPTEEDDEEFESIRKLLNSEYSVTTNQKTMALKSDNLVVLSWKNTSGAPEEDEQCNNDKRDLAFVKDTLAKTDSLSNQMEYILGEFNKGLSSLERDVAPINASMKEWSTIFNNINATMDSIKSVLERFDLSKVEQKIREGAKGDYTSYMVTLEQIVHSIDFLTANSQYKSSDKTLSTLKELKQTGLNELENNFKSLLVKISTIIDPTTIPPLPPAKRYLAIVSPVAVEEISKSIELFSKLHYTAFLKEYREKRSKFIYLSLLKMSPEKFIKTTESKNLAYVKGTHPLIPYVYETLRLYQIESDLAKELFGTQYHTILFDIVKDPQELLLETTEPIIKFKRTVDKVFGIFPLLDLFETFKRALPGFEDALSERDGKHVLEIKDILVTLELTCSALLKFSLDEEFKKEEKSDPSTTVDEVSSNMLNYYKRLVEYRDTVEFLLSRSKSSFNEFLETTLRSLGKYLQTKSKKDFPTVSVVDFNKVPIKGNIFLINNYQYTVTSLQSTQILDSQSFLLKEFETDLGNEIKVFASFWNTFADQLKFVKGKDDTKTIVKKHSNFLKTMNELSKLKFEIPDQEMKEKLKSDSKAIVSKVYDKFKEICRQDKIHLEKNFAPFESTEDINRKIDRIFDTQ